MAKELFVVCSLCVVGLLTYARRVAQSEDIIHQKKQLAAQKESPEEGFFIVYNQKGEIVEQENVNLGENVFANPEVSTIFHKCAGRALRGGGYTRFLWPDREGRVRMHMAYAYMDERNNASVVVTVAEPKK
jgi:signal transduction histidine kinase